VTTRGACNNHETHWARFANVLYPDAAVCPTFEIDLAWKRDPKRHFKWGLCHCCYNCHHCERGNGDPVLPGHQRRFGVTLTANPRRPSRSSPHYATPVR
jgi:hypothetical protein